MDTLPLNFIRILRNCTVWANLNAFTLPKIAYPRYEFVEYANDGKTMIVRMK